MAGFTKGEAIADHETKLGIIGEAFYMVGIQFPSFLSTLLASKLITCENGQTPELHFDRVADDKILISNSTFPVRCFASIVKFPTTRTIAKLSGETAISMYLKVLSTLATFSTYLANQVSSRFYLIDFLTNRLACARAKMAFPIKTRRIDIHGFFACRARNEMSAFHGAIIA